jgi:hypothetical protein
MSELVEILLRFQAWFIRDRKYRIKFEPYIAGSNNDNIVARCNAIVFYNYCPSYDPSAGTGGVVVTVGNFPIPQNSFFSVPANAGEIDMSEYKLVFHGTAASDQVVWVSRKIYEDQKIN